MFASKKVHADHRTQIFLLNLSFIRMILMLVVYCYYNKWRDWLLHVLLPQEQ